MKRECSLEDISDGRIYGKNDMVKVGCHDCAGCHSCCQGMGNSVILDPLDVYLLRKNLGMSMELLLADKLELNVVDGLILPNLKMAGEQESCNFLDENGRCSIHAFRPGICRIFPLGRYYENHSFQYILQVKECPMENKTKMKVSKWISLPDEKETEGFILDWHYFILDLQKRILSTEDNQERKQMNLYILQLFFFQQYEEESSFFPQFYKRLDMIKKVMEPQ